MTDEVSVIKKVLSEISERMPYTEELHEDLNVRVHYYVSQISVLMECIGYLNAHDCHVYVFCESLRDLLMSHKKNNEDMLQLIMSHQQMSNIISELQKTDMDIIKLSESIQVPIIQIQKEYEIKLKPWKIQTRCLLVTNIILSCLLIYTLYF